VEKRRRELKEEGKKGMKGKGEEEVGGVKYALEGGKQDGFLPILTFYPVQSKSEPFPFLGE
jgi:hypothetical protein